MKVKLNKDNYLKYGNKYFIEFEYENKKEKETTLELFNMDLIPRYGSNSKRANNNQEYIMPFFSNTNEIGGTNIPEDLLEVLLQKLVEDNKVTLQAESIEMKDNFDHELFSKMVEKLSLGIELKKDNFFNYGKKYFIEFKYGNEEQQKKVYNLFDSVLIDSCGATSKRAEEDKDYIMPYFINEAGEVTSENTGIIGGTSIPEDLLPEFIRFFIEAEGAKVKMEDTVIKKFDYDQFFDALSKLEIQVELKYEDYFDYGKKYFIEFKYGSKKQQEKIYNLFNNELLKSYGSHSKRAEDKEEYIMPYLVDEFDEVTIKDTKIIGGTSIPKDLLPSFIRRLVEVENATVKIGKNEIKDNFNIEEFNSYVDSINEQNSK